MSIKSKVLAAAATVTMVGGVGLVSTLTAGTASAATPSCGNSCINLFSRQFGTHAEPNYVVDVLRQGEKVGQPIILFRTANFDPAEDWTAAFQGTTADFFAAGLVSSAVALHYGCIGGVNFPDCYGFPTAVVNDPAFEIEYAPFGVDSGLCMGVASTAVQGEGVTLQACGVSSKTVWIADTGNGFALSPNAPLGDSPDTLLFGYAPVINGSDTNFSQPFVLTYPSTGFPTDKPRPPLQVHTLAGFSNPSPPFFFSGPQVGTVNDSQLWGADFGILK